MTKQNSAITRHVTVSQSDPMEPNALLFPGWAGNDHEVVGRKNSNSLAARSPTAADPLKARPDFRNFRSLAELPSTAADPLKAWRDFGEIRTRWQHGLQPRQTPSRPGQTSGTFGRWHHGLLPLQAPLRLSQTLGNRKLFAHYVPEIHLSFKHVDVSCRVCSWNSCMFGLLMLSVIFSWKQ